MLPSSRARRSRIPGRSSVRTSSIFSSIERSRLNDCLTSQPKAMHSGADAPALTTEITVVVSTRGQRFTFGVRSFNSSVTHASHTLANPPSNPPTVDHVSSPAWPNP